MTENTTVADDAEISVLGRLLLYPGELYDAEISSEHFFNPARRKVYELICELHADGIEVDPLTIEDRANGRLGITAELLLTFTERMIFGVSMQRHAEVLLNRYLERELRKACHEVLASDLGGVELVEHAQQLIAGINVATRSKGAVKLEQVLQEVMAEAERRRAGEKPAGLATGVEEVDRFMALAPGGVLTVAGRPSMGKSALCEWLVEQAVAQGERVLWFSTESHRQSVGHRLLSRATGINSRAIEKATLDWEGWTRVRGASQDLSKWPVWIDDSNADLRTMCREIRKGKALEGITMVVVDHLQEITNRQIKTRSAMEVVNSILVGLRTVVRESPKVYLVLVSQLNRGVESRESKRPLMSDLRDSGKIEEVSDAILLVFREYYYDRKSSPTRMETAFAKNRNGPTGQVAFWYDHELGQVSGPMTGGG